ncbi:hypothetical protein HMPREF1861_01827 [Corynebacterium kroppenstedtii]|nr:hypothetical protein HMPREF1861_01827 [Corynebacterium kroppenstedtii]
MGFVDDEHAVPGFGGCVDGSVAEVSHVFDAAVAGRVEFGDVEGAWAAGGKCSAGFAFPAGGRCGPVHAVERAREDAGGGGFTAAAGSGEQVRMIDASGVECSAKGHGDVFLADDVGECCGTVLPVKSHVCMLPPG